MLDQSIIIAMSWCWIYSWLLQLASQAKKARPRSTVKIQYGPQRTSPFKLTMDISHSSIIIMYPWFYGGGVIRIWQYTDVLSAVLFKFIINSKLQYSISLIKLLMIKMMRTRNINMGSLHFTRWLSCWCAFQWSLPLAKGAADTCRTSVYCHILITPPL